MFKTKKKMKRNWILLTLLFLLLPACSEKEDPEIPDFPGKEEKTDPSDNKEPEEVTPQGPYDLSVLDKPLKDVKVLTSGTWLQNASVMQSFVLPGDGTMLANQLAPTGSKHKISVTRKGITSNSGKTMMRLSFFGHGDNMAHQKDASGNIWLWIGCHGTNAYYERNDVKDVMFTYGQTVARVKFEPGKDVYPEDVQDLWYIPGLKCLSPALDLEARQVAFYGYDASKVYYYYVFNLDDALALAKKEVTLAYPIIRGPSEDYSLDPITYKVKVRNLSELKPVAKLTLTKKVFQGQPYELGSLTNQGFELREGRIYHYYGGGNDSDTSKSSVSVVTVFDFNGKIVDQRRVMAIADLKDLADAGITDYGFMESEGIKIYGDKLYLGYATKKKDDQHRYVTILEYDLPRKAK